MNSIDYKESYIDGIAREYWEIARNPEALDKQIAAELFKTTGLTYTEQLLAELREKKLEQMKTEAVAKLQERIDSVRKVYQEDKAKLDRIELRASTGDRLAEEYSKKHGIDLDKAKAELREYAERKTSNYSDSLPDRYAAIRNRGKEINQDDARKAHNYHKQELEALGYNEKQRKIKDMEHFCNNNGLNLLNQWNTSGEALIRQMKRQGKM